MLVEPLAALLLGDEAGGVLADPLALDEPPDAGALGVAPEAELEELASPGFASPGFLDMSTDAEPEVELEPEGVLGVVEPADEDAPELGVVLETARSPSLSQPVSNPALSARDTATARAESLICRPPWVGVRLNGARIRPDALPSEFLWTIPLLLQWSEAIPSRGG